MGRDILIGKGALVGGDLLIDSSLGATGVYEFIESMLVDEDDVCLSCASDSFVGEFARSYEIEFSSTDRVIGPDKLLDKRAADFGVIELAFGESGDSGGRREDDVVAAVGCFPGSVCLVAKIAEKLSAVLFEFSGIIAEAGNKRVDGAGGAVAVIALERFAVLPLFLGAARDKEPFGPERLGQPRCLEGCWTGEREILEEHKARWCDQVIVPIAPVLAAVALWCSNRDSGAPGNLRFEACSVVGGYLG